MLRKLRNLNASLIAIVLILAMTSSVYAQASSAVTLSAASDYDTVFTFSSVGITVSGNATGYEIDTDTPTFLTINSAGNYLVTGACTNGQVKVKKGVTGVILTLSDLDLSCTNCAPIVCNKYTHAGIIIDGTVNLADTVYNSEDYLINVEKMTEDEAEDAGAENAVMKFKGGSKIAISGSGTLNITAKAKNGIKSGAALDSSNGDTELAGDSSAAFLTVEGITLNVDATNVYKPDSDTYGDCINAESYLHIKNGTYNLQAGDDALHCDYTLDLGSSGASDSALDVNIGSSVSSTGAVEGIEGAIINVYSGDYDLFCSDDCLNAANSDLSDQNYQYQMNIYGGDIYAVSTGEGDALDSNGNITMNGGNVVVIGGSSGNAVDTGTDGNSAIDDSLNITGGTLFGIGSSNMAIVPTSSSQSWVAWGYGGNSGQPGGSMSFGPRQSRNTTSSGNTAATNMSNASAVTLKTGSGTYSVGSSVSISSGTTVSVLNGSETLASVKALNAASFVLYSADISSSGSTTGTNSNTATDTNNSTESDNSFNPGSGPYSGNESDSLYSRSSRFDEDADREYDQDDESDDYDNPDGDTDSNYDSDYDSDHDYDSDSGYDSDSDYDSDTSDDQDSEKSSDSDNDTDSDNNTDSDSSDSSSTSDTTKKKTTESITIKKKPTISKLKSKNKKITVTLKYFKRKNKTLKKLWKSIKKIEIQYSTSSKFTDVSTKTIKKSKTKVTLKNLKKGVRYYVRVRYCSSTGYSKWSKVKSIKVK